MSIVRIAVPVLQARRKFYFDKGRPWSVLEHILLDALANKSATVPELAKDGMIPRRVVIEALIRLMRAGWAEMTQSTATVSFYATEEGKAAAILGELPNVARRLNRRISFVVDQITGTIYRSRELPFAHTHAVEQRQKREKIIWLERPKHIFLDEVRPLVEALFSDDEKFVSMEASGDRLAERWALVTVRDGEPDGLTHRAPEALIDIVKGAAAGSVSQNDNGQQVHQRLTDVPSTTSLSVCPKSYCII